MVEFEPFHSAVNRIPVLRDKAQEKGYSPDLFDDRQAFGHDRLADDRWSGSIHLEITVRAPLVFGKQDVEEVVESDGKKEKRHFVEVPRNRDGTLHVPPTMIKGMISRAFETLTCSRFRIFGDVPNETDRRRHADDHSIPLTYRPGPASALRLVPARVESVDPKTRDVALELLYGFSRESKYNVKGKPMEIMRAASLPDPGSKKNPDCRHYTFKRGEIVTDVKKLRKLVQHKQTVDFEASLCIHRGHKKQASYLYWLVTHVTLDKVGEQPQVVEIATPQDYVIKHSKFRGYVYRTYPNNTNKFKGTRWFDGKHDERIFFRRGERLLVTARRPVHDSYINIVNSYLRLREEQRDSHLPRSKQETPNRVTVTASKTKDASAPDLKSGDLVYAVLSDDSYDDNGTIVKNAARISVIELVPIMVGRRSYECSPVELAKKQFVMPPSGRNLASAADRVFGYVVPPKKDKKKEPKKAEGGDVASRGHISISSVNGAEAYIVSEPVLLSPLLAPKPSSARRFLTARDGGTPQPWKGITIKRDDLFSSGQYLGRAAYPVHRSALTGNAFPEQASMLAGDQDNYKVRLTAKSWVDRESVLRCTLTFTNLSDDELAALVWVLTPENLVPESERSRNAGALGYLQMGLGKPFGLGALEVRIAENGLHARSGAALARSYESLDGCLGLNDPVVPTSDFPLPDEEELLGEPWVQAMQRAAYGYNDNLEVRYMTLDENKKNNQTKGSTGDPKAGRGISPRDLWGPDSGTPIQVGP